MHEYLSDRVFKAGFVLLVVGTGPLLAVMLVAPHSNPVGPGLLAALTFWPAVICMVIGFARVRRRRG